MPVMDNTVTVDLNKGIRFASVDIGEEDSYANRFGAKVVASGQQVDLTGASAQGLFIREDGATFDIQGGVEDGVVFVELTPDCYAVVGRYQLTLKMISGSALITLRIIEGRVLRARAGGAGGGGGSSGGISDETLAVINGRLTTVETKAGTAYTKASELDNKVGTMESRLDNHADAIETLQKELDSLEEQILARAVNGWPVVSPNGTLYAIFVNDDGTLRVGEYIEG